MDRLAEAGSVILGVPVGNGQQILRVVRAADKDIRARLATDLRASVGLLQIDTTESWQLRLHSWTSIINTRSAARKAGIAGAGNSHPTRA
jgi:hypothetical protein